MRGSLVSRDDAAKPACRGESHIKAKHLIASLCVLAAATPAFAYPPKTADWQALSQNAADAIAAWNAADYPALTQAAPEDEEAQRAYFSETLAAVDQVCTRLRAQIGTGGLFGPDMWTQGFSQACWSIGSAQRSTGAVRGKKICQEAKASLNFFKQFRPARTPADYPLAAEHVAAFSEIAEMMKASVTGCK